MARQSAYSGGRRPGRRIRSEGALKALQQLSHRASPRFGAQPEAAQEGEGGERKAEPAA
jgi:hypothetical protein